MYSYMKKGKNIRNILFFGVAIIVIALVVLWNLKPTAQIVQTPEQASDLDFIADNIVQTGVPKDGIPPIDNPTYLPADQTDISNDEIVFGIVINGEARAYPSSVMYWHEIVNDNINNQQVSVTFCPLTGTVQGFLNQHLGVSGKLSHSNLVMYDRDTDSLFPQIIATAVTGPKKGTTLEQFPVTVTTWKLWKQQYPNTLILSRETGFPRDYDDKPYPGYEYALQVWFPVAAKSDLFHSKKIVHGVENNGEFLAIPKEEFKQEKTTMLGEEEITIKYNKALNTIETFKGEQQLPSFDTFWFAWYAYHPETKVLE